MNLAVDDIICPHTTDLRIKNDEGEKGFWAPRIDACRLRLQRCVSLLGSEVNKLRGFSISQIPEPKKLELIKTTEEASR